MIYFIHILKTGGTTFDNILVRQYGLENIINLNNIDVDIEFDHHHHEPKIQEELKTKKHTVAVTGHFRYGLHKRFPEENFKYIAFFRNPVEQYLSQYYYITSLDEYPDIKEMSSKRGNIDEFVYSDLLLYTQDTQTYFLTEAESRSVFQGNLTLMSETAIENLKKSFIFCGITDRFDESVIILKELLGWKKLPYYIKKKVNKHRPSIKQHKAETIARIQELNKLDFKLYNKALEIFNEDI